MNTDVALDFVEGRMETALEGFWHRHIETCAECAAEVDEWKLFSRLAKRRHLDSAPDAVLASTIALFEHRAQMDKPSLREILASMVFDSFAQPAFGGARGEATARQLVLRAEEFDIHVRIWTTENGREMLGQIQSRSDDCFTADAHLHLLHNGERIGSSDLNDLGEFYFALVPDGFLSLQIDLPHLTVIGALNTTE
jgi:hypothetical protein